MSRQTIEWHCDGCGALGSTCGLGLLPDGWASVRVLAGGPTTRRELEGHVCGGCLEALPGALNVRRGRPS